jgi:signal transduction histidine kinase
MSESKTRELEIAAAAEQVEMDPVFSALQAAGAPVLAAAGDPLRIFYMNDAAKAVFGADADAVNDALFGDDESVTLCLSELAKYESRNAAPRLERVEIPFRGQIQTVTILCRNTEETADAPSCLVMATLGLRPARNEADAGDGRRADRIPRFLWRTDADGRFIEVTQILADVVGAENADILGRDAVEVVRALEADAGARLFQALSQRTSWSGIELRWPVAAGGSVSTTLGAVPAFDEARRFVGFRGYGALRKENDGAVRVETTANENLSDRLDEAALAALDYGNVIPLRPLNAPQRGDEVAKADASVGERPQPGLEEALTPKEKDAFEEIARALESMSQPVSPRGSVHEVIDLAGRAGGTADEEDKFKTSSRAHDSLSRHAASLVDRLPIGVLIARGAKILFVNRTLLEWLDYSDPEAFETDGGLDRMFCDPAFGANVSAEEGVGAIGISSRSGQEIGFDAQLQTIDWDENGPAALITLQRAAAPVTGGERATERLQTAAQLEAERASAAKSDLLARVSHEIRTPLSAILGFAEVMMEERFGPIGNERYKEYLNDIHVSGAHVLSLVNDLLDLSKIEAGKLNLEFEGVDINAIVEECASIMQAQASRARVVMRLSLSPSLPRVRADQRSLKQILLNLLSNALKFNQPGGQVIVSSALTDAGSVVLRIKDTGVGMSTDDIQTALEPFQQLGPASEISGTGLGLPVTKALIEANHASFSIRSRKNEGTLVEIAFAPPQVLAAE